MRYIPLYRLHALTLLAPLLAACEPAPSFDAVEPAEALAGGATTVQRADRHAFSLPAANLPLAQRVDFSAGHSFFRNPWVIAPSTTTARDSLGPLFNANACQACHIRDGRGHPPAADARNAVSMLVRLSIPARAGDQAIIQRLGVVPEPTYGTQLQDMAIPGVVPEGRVRVAYQPVPVQFADGHRVTLRRPQLRIDALGYGPLHPDTQFSARIAPPMIGLGLLEAIPQQAIVERAAQQQALGLNGQPNWVRDDSTGTVALGRFGWKAGQPNLDQQNAHAASQDIGLSTSLLAEQTCSDTQLACRAAPTGDGTGGAAEISDNIRPLLQFYTRHVAVPARRGVADAKVLAGKQLFNQAGCQLCHVPQWTTAAATAEPALAGQRIWPYTDLLLHDMGAGLADQREEFLASGQQWRTPPLWGLGLTRSVSGHYQLLHDGRARDPLEAVLWHGGEAAPARERVLAFNAEQRAALLAFLDSL
ncbi:di-heme oxidoredictase family protein [Pseudomonas typographi]|uniref:C-type cytochrome n=1 Tax=Pseudomonas typographi TaxID=2715964 RepID=A0ABR7YWA9_9PSED|nr:di-heme oxidoredictase family protein [Pseudomonas typographi]MBD1597473.1 c-type cytochrome [Pseudomonas typographi]